MIRLVEDTINNNNIDSLIDWLKTYPRLTKGPLTIEFEKKWSEWIGCNYSLYVNSGSSANLILLYSLVAGNYLKNKKIVVPGLSWATDLAPVIQLGLTPILCDINLKNLSVDLESLEDVFIREEPSALLLVSVLGLVPDMKAIFDLCKKYDVLLLGDHCESFGSKYGDRKLGNCGELASTFSLYFGHHLSTIEGGMVCTNDENLYDLLLMLRSHGWSRDLTENKRTELQTKWNVNDFNNLYTFYHPGFNLRCTDLQAFIGITQLQQADDICINRNKNFNIFNSLVKTNELDIVQSDSNNFVSAFAYPFVNKNIEEAIIKLNESQIECRPLICGSMGKQPMYVNKFDQVNLANCDIIDKYGIYLPCHDKLKENDIEIISNILNGV